MVARRENLTCGRSAHPKGGTSGVIRERLGGHRTGAQAKLCQMAIVTTTAEAVEFIRSDRSGPVSAGWDQMAGFFYGLRDDPDRQWAALREVASATDDEDKLVSLAVFVLEAMIEPTQDTLESRLRVACASPSVRKMLRSCDVSSRYIEILDRFATSTEDL